MSKYRNFELSEFLKSDRAKAAGIDNTPTFEVVDNLNELVEKLLQPLRAAVGKPIEVSSGYRCARLNQLVGGSSTSAHLYGYAADTTCPYMTFSRYRDFVIEWAKRTGAKFDQIIVEHERATGKEWVHIAIKNGKGQQRGQILNMIV